MDRPSRKVENWVERNKRESHIIGVVTAMRLYKSRAAQQI